jgi:pyruvate kinase
VKTKIAVTLGPSLHEAREIAEAISLGCKIFRINFSHGDKGFWTELADSVRAAAEKTGESCVLVADLPGGSIRVTGLSQPVRLASGELVEFSEAGPVGLSNPAFYTTAEVGDLLVTDDGRGLLRVVGVGKGKISAEAVKPLTLGPNKSVVIRGKEVVPVDYLESSKPALEAAADLQVDFIGLSFTRSADDVKAVREFLSGMNFRPGLIAKIETPSGMRNVREIADAADALLIARGDLGMHYELEIVPRLQKAIIDAGYDACKPVIVATQLLGSMVYEPVPSRSEVVDVMNCVEEGVDVLMLTAETAVGKYPLEAIKWLANISTAYEKSAKPRRTLPVDAQTVDRFALAVVSLAEAVAGRIAIFTMNGNMARRIARFKPVGGVIAATPNPRVLPLLAMLWGVTPLHIEAATYTEGLDRLEKKVEETNLVEKGETLILTYGLVEEPVHIVKMKKYV